MTSDELQAILAELENRRRDFHRFVSETFPGFKDGWVYQVLCAKLREFMLRVRREESPRLIICFPPRHGKSETTSIRFALWCLLNNPEWEIVVASYAQSLSSRFSRRARALVDHEFVQSLWDVKLDPEHAAVQEWRVMVEGQRTQNGTYRAVGRGSGVTGTGAHVLIADDLIKDQQEADSLTVREALWNWWTSTAFTRLSPGGGALIVQTRWHEEDLIGKLQKEMGREGAEQWEVLSFPAIAEHDDQYRKRGEALHPPRYSAAALKSIEGVLPTRWWDGLYQQRPRAAGGVIVHTDWLKHWDTLPPLEEMEEIIQSWDLRTGKSQEASTSFVVGQVWGRIGANRYLIDQVRGRWGYVQSRDAIETLRDRYPMCIAKVIENKANGPAISDDLQDSVEGMVMWNPRGDKVQRLERVSPLFRAGNVFIPPAERYPWVRDYIAELTSFPNAPNDDQVDCTSMALGYMQENGAGIGDVEMYAL